MDRTKFYHVLTVDKIQELDYLWNTLSKINLTYVSGYYRVNVIDLMRPDLISFKVYGTVDFWWIILLVNEIDDPLTDLEEGMILEIPNKIDIYEFQKQFRVR
jgi:hypothetical protein